MKTNDFHLEQSEHNRRHLESIKALGEIGASTKSIAQYLGDLKKSHTKIITLVPTSPFPYAAEGYGFSSLYVGDSQAADACKIVVSVDGVSYTVTLTAGENTVNFPDGATLNLENTSGNSTSFILSRYNIYKG